MGLGRIERLPFRREDLEHSVGATVVDRDLEVSGGESPSEAKVDASVLGGDHLHTLVAVVQGDANQVLRQIHAREVDRGVLEARDPSRVHANLERRVVLERIVEDVDLLEAALEEALEIEVGLLPEILGEREHLARVGASLARAEPFLDERLELHLDRVEIVEDLEFFLAKLLGGGLPAAAVRLAEERLVDPSGLRGQLLGGAGALQEILEERGEAVHVALEIESSVVGIARGRDEGLGRVVASIDVLLRHVGRVTEVDAGVEHLIAIALAARQPVGARYRLDGDREHAARVPLPL